MSRVYCSINLNEEKLQRTQVHLNAAGAEIFKTIILAHFHFYFAIVAALTNQALSSN